MAAAAFVSSPSALLAKNEMPRLSGTHIKFGLNAYSFNGPLSRGTRAPGAAAPAGGAGKGGGGRKGGDGAQKGGGNATSTMTWNDVIEFCARTGIDGLDPTGYYFTGYPAVPSDKVIADFKRRCFLNGIPINCTGVRNNFAQVDAAARQKDVQLIKDWVHVAQKMGAYGLRVFSGNNVPAGRTFDQVLTEYMVPAFREICAYAGDHGVVIALQHHDDYLKTADETIKFMQAVDSEWLGLVLDIGSVRTGDPYAEIEKLIPYACSWQIKEQVYRNEKAEATDMAKIKEAIVRTGYRGFVPFEALEGGGSPEVITKFFQHIKQGFGMT